MDGLDDFSRSFADALFAAVPKLRDHARVNNERLEVDLEPGPKREHCAFWVSTHDEEITVGFGLWHTHFDWPLRDDWPENDPIALVRAIMSDETLIEDWTLDGKWTGSSTLEAGEKADLSGMEPGHVVYIRSWSGARDETIRGK